MVFTRFVGAAALMVSGTVLFAQPQGRFSPTSVGFGTIPLNTASQQTFYVANGGNAALQVTGFTSTNPAMSVSPLTAIVAAGDSVAMTLVMRPRLVGPDTGSVGLVTNDPSFTGHLSVSGTGQATVPASIVPYRSDAKGNVQYRKEGVMDGNQVLTLFNNNGEVGHWPFQPSGIWPKGTNHSYLDGVSVLIGAKVLAPGNNRVVTPVLAAYREEVDQDPITRELWVLEPVPGYAKPSATRPAINKDTSTIPNAWPQALGLTPEWDGFWYGYFGRGVTNSDFETFFVMDDSKDKEFTRPPFNYYPLSGDSTHGGIGVRVEVRGFQWSHVLAEDIVFWHYDIVNISDWDHDTTCFGFYTDPGVGGTNNSGNSGRYDTRLDLAYAWNPQGTGTPDNWKTGYVGYAYLESPGNSTNGIDDDEDGMVDETRDDGVDNDGDWVPYADLDNSGDWNIGEPLNDDLGRDGVGPQDLQWTGADVGEADGVPTPGEPNFDQTDKDESDQIGLQAVALYILADKGPTGGWPKNDDVMWNKMNSGFRDTTVNNTNISMVFSSGPFPLKQGRRERFSMALAFGEDLEDIIFNKETVQEIYDANYNFSKPPYTPHVTAVPGDGRVFLYWDAIAEQSVDRFMGLEDPNDPSKGYKRDFEGYLVYRSSDAEFNDIKLITDSKGSPKYWKPIAQFDLVDSIAGPDPVGINGAHFWRGNNTGLQHTYIDSTVTNGMRYYYAVVSYDMGDPNKGTNGLQPTECTKIITEDFNGVLKFVDINCAVVTPNAPSAGYVPPGVDGDLSTVTSGIGTGHLELTVLNPVEVTEGTQYDVTFSSTGLIAPYKTSDYSIIRTKGGAVDTLLKNVPMDKLAEGKYTGPFDGMILAVSNDTSVTIDYANSGWLVGSSTVVMLAAADNSIQARNVAWAADYEIRFFGSAADTTAFSLPPRYPQMPVPLQITNTTSGERVRFIVDDVDNSVTLSIGDTIRILDGYVNASTFKIVYKVTYGQPFGIPVLPQDGDRYVLRTKRPFMTDDRFTFKTIASRSDADLARSELSRISVVPNPYIATATWERRTLYVSGRGDRKIEFKNLPTPCTIRIYTVTGQLVKTLYKESDPTDGSKAWDLISDDGADIAYGLYVYHVEAPGVGEHIGKFAVVK